MFFQPVLKYSLICLSLCAGLFMCPAWAQNQFMDGHDERNPLRIFRRPISMDIYNLSVQLAAGVDDEHEKILAFMKYIDGFKTGVASDSKLDTTVAERVGACGTFSNLLLALAAAQGLEGRVVGFYNYPESNGHVVAEIKINNKWHLYEPTYNAFYTLSRSDEVLSFEEIKDAYTAGLEVMIHMDSNRRGSNLFTGKEIFTRANPSGVIGPNQPMYYPLTLDVQKRSSVEFSEFGPSWQGTHYIGAAYVNNNQNWTFLGLRPGVNYIFELTPKRLGGDDVTRESRNFELHAFIPPPLSRTRTSS